MRHFVKAAPQRHDSAITSDQCSLSRACVLSSEAGALTSALRCPCTGDSGVGKSCLLHHFLNNRCKWLRALLSGLHNTDKVAPDTRSPGSFTAHDRCVGSTSNSQRQC